VSLAAAANREIVMPKIREHLANDSKNIGGEQAANMQPRLDSETGIFISGDKIVPAETKIVNPAFVLPRQFNQFGKQLTAAEAKYMPAEGDRPSGYMFYAVTRPKALLKSPWLLQDNKPIIMTPVGANWLAKDSVFVASGVSFEFLAAGATWRDFASTREMIEQLRSPSTDLGADVRVAIHGRFLQPLLDTTLLFLGLPFVVTRTNRNPFISLGLCLAVVTIFMIVELASQSLGSGGWLPPPLAAWLPLMIFAPIAAFTSSTLSQ
jgi:lipopolysaccharide export system permease protein